MNDNNDLPFWLALWRTPGIGPAHFNQAIKKFVSLAKLFHTPEAASSRCGFAPELITALKKPDWKNVDADLTWASQSEHFIITSNMSDYPHQLKEISNAPPLLFVTGNKTCAKKAQIAIVGSRNPTAVGIDNAYQFAKSFAHADFIITSGLALGIDAASHEGALAAKGRTIAIMGTGPDKIYPKRHEALTKKIIEQGGAIITEFPTGVTPHAANFPRRNRIISGLSVGTLVVEAAYGSGSLITAHYALEQNREVFAIPGSIHNPLARGCHALIKQGAKLVEAAQDVLDELQQWAKPSQTVLKAPAPFPPPLALSNDQEVLLSYIGYETTPVDTLVDRTGLTAEAVSSILLLLELDGYISAAPGGYMRVK